jgi:hypothetical protein
MIYTTGALTGQSGISFGKEGRVMTKIINNIFECDT